MAAGPSLEGRFGIAHPEPGGVDERDGDHDGDFFTFEFVHVDGNELIWCHGDLDYVAAADSAEAIAEFARRRDVIIDLTDVGFIDSGGLGALVSIDHDFEDPIRLQGAHQRSVGCLR